MGEFHAFLIIAHNSVQQRQASCNLVVQLVEYVYFHTFQTIPKVQDVNTRETEKQQQHKSQIAK